MSPMFPMAAIQKRRGHWADRLAGIDTDIAAMRARLQRAAHRLSDAPLPSPGDRTPSAGRRALPPCRAGHVFVPARRCLCPLRRQRRRDFRAAALSPCQSGRTLARAWICGPTASFTPRFRRLHRLAVSRCSIISSCRAEPRLALSCLQRDAVQPALLCGLETHNLTSRTFDKNNWWETSWQKQDADGASLHPVGRSLGRGCGLV